MRASLAQASPNSGFTIVELTIVIILSTLLFGIALASMTARAKESRHIAGVAQLLAAVHAAQAAPGREQAGRQRDLWHLAAAEALEEIGGIPVPASPSVHGTSPPTVQADSLAGYIGRTAAADEALLLDDGGGVVSYVSGTCPVGAVQLIVTPKHSQMPAGHAIHGATPDWLVDWLNGRDGLIADHDGTSVFACAS